MASMRDIKHRIKSVGNTQQITKAMNLVAVSKLQRAKARIVQSRPYFDETRKVISSIVGGSKGVRHKFLETREVKHRLYIVINGDRGLCGGYNANIAKEAYAAMRSGEAAASVIAIGNKAREFFRRRGAAIKETYTGLSEQPFYADAADVGALATAMFERGETDEVYLAYTEFKSALSHEPHIIKLLPLNPDEFAHEGGAAVMEFEPNEEAVLDFVIPKYVNTVLFGALVESAACEQGARMTAMDSATENATDMISSLTLQYNRARQGTITQEITEIVGGANALG